MLWRSRDSDVWSWSCKKSITKNCETSSRIQRNQRWSTDANGRVFLSHGEIRLALRNGGNSTIREHKDVTQTSEASRQQFVLANKFLAWHKTLAVGALFTSWPWAFVVEQIVIGSKCGEFLEPASHS